MSGVFAAVQPHTLRPVGAQRIDEGQFCLGVPIAVYLRQAANSLTPFFCFQLILGDPRAGAIRAVCGSFQVLLRNHRAARFDTTACHQAKR
jgi:hypothetical protein